MNELEQAAKLIMDLADELYQFGRNGRTTTEEDNLTLGMLMYRTVLRSLKDHCEERNCTQCVFASGEHGECLLCVAPDKYDIEKIQEAIRKNVKEEGENRWV